MLTFAKIAAGIPSDTAAMTRHMLTQTIPKEVADLARYYTRGMEVKADEAMPRRDMHPIVARGLGIDPDKPVSIGQINALLAGRRADGEKIVVKRNEKYWKPNRPYPDGIEFSIIPELTTGARSVSASQNDLIYQLPPRQKAIIERASSVKVVHGPTLYVFQIFLNWAKPPFDNVKVRQALNFAIDREAFAKAALAGLAEPAYMNLPKSHWAYDAEVAKLYPYDPDKARKLLAEAGFKEGTAIEIGGYTDQDSVQREEILIEQLRKAGINVKFVNGTVAEASAAFFGAEKKGAGLLSAWTGRPDPSLTYSLMFTKDAYYNAGRAPVPRVEWLTGRIPSPYTAPTAPDPSPCAPGPVLPVVPVSLPSWGGDGDGHGREDPKRGSVPADPATFSERSHVP